MSASRQSILRLAMLGRMNRLLAPLTGLALASLLAACGSPRKSVVVQRSAGATAPAPARAPLDGSSYVVRKGDTLYSIAFRKGVDFRELARWNGDRKSVV